MSEKVLRAVKIERPETPCVKYTMQVSASFAEDELFPVPEEYIAHILANNLREYVMHAVTDESIAKILKSGIPTVCPKCGREMVDDGKMAHGTLTAEQVREAIERHSTWVIGNNRCFHDGAYEEIAAELEKMIV